MPFHGAGFQGSLIEKARRKEHCVTPLSPPCASAALLHCTVTCLSLSASFPFLLSYTPANAMRQLFQRTISLWPRLWFDTPLCVFLLVLLALVLLLSSSGHPSLGLSSWTPAFFCVTQHKYMHPSMRALLACVHTYMGHTTTGSLLFHFLLPFPLPCPPPFRVSSRLPFPGSWEEKVVAENKHPPTHPAPDPPGTFTPVSCPPPLLTSTHTYRAVLFARRISPSQVNWGPRAAAHGRGPGAVSKLRTRRRQAAAAAAAPAARLSHGARCYIPMKATWLFQVTQETRPVTLGGWFGLVRLIYRSPFTSSC